MNKVGKKIRELRLSHKPSMKQKELAEAIGISTVYMSDVERGLKEPSYEVIVKAAKALGAPLSKLLPKEVEPAEVPRHKIPLISWVRAGSLHEPIDIYQPGFAEEWIGSNASGSGAFALRVAGNSMCPEFLDGDIIVVDPSIEPASGDYGIVKVNDEVTFKRIHFYLNKIVLEPINKEGHEAIEITRDDGFNVQIIGKVIEQIRRR